VVDGGADVADLPLAAQGARGGVVGGDGVADFGGEFPGGGAVLEFVEGGGAAVVVGLEEVVFVVHRHGKNAGDGWEIDD